MDYQEIAAATQAAANNNLNNEVERMFDCLAKNGIEHESCYIMTRSFDTLGYHDEIKAKGSFLYGNGMLFPLDNLIGVDSHGDIHLSTLFIRNPYLAWTIGESKWVLVSPTLEGAVYKYGIQKGFSIDSMHRKFAANDNLECEAMHLFV